MQLDYPVLRSDDLPGKYGVSGFPTLVIIDQSSKVADVHVGYSAAALPRGDGGRRPAARGEVTPGPAAGATSFLHPP